MPERLMKIAVKAKQDLESGAVDRQLLARLNGERYPRVGEADRLVELGLSMFPRLCCGIASVYLRHLLGEGEIVNGQYKGKGHNFLLVNGILVDITADQFGGPPIYVGSLIKPWRMQKSNN